MKSSLNRSSAILLVLNITHQLCLSYSNVGALQTQLTPRHQSVKENGFMARNRLVKAGLFLSDVTKDDFSDLDIVRTDNRPIITEINSEKEYEEYISQNTDSRLTVVKFYASWCKSCAKFGVRYKKLAKEHGDCFDPTGAITKEGNMRFAQVEFGDNLKLCRSLGIKRLPYVYIYRGDEGLLCDFACGPKKFPVLIDKVNEYLGMSQEEIDFFRVFNEGNNLSKEIAPILQVTKKEEKKEEKKNSMMKHLLSVFE